MFERMNNLMKQNPVLQFSKASAMSDGPMLSDKFSPTGTGAGLGQTLGAPSRMERDHASMVRQQQLRFGMMKFEMNKKRLL